MTVGRRSKSGWGMELDVAGYHPQINKIVHYEPSIDALGWAEREARQRLLECANSLDTIMNKQNRKTHLFEIDRGARTTRRTKPKSVKQIHITEKRSTGEKIKRNHQYETTLEDAET